MTFNRAEVSIPAHNIPEQANGQSECAVHPGQRLKELRQEMSRSQRAFGEPVGLTQAAVSAFEQGKVAFKKPDALAIEHVYAVRHEWLLFGEGPKTRDAPELSDDDNEVLGIHRNLSSSDRAIWVRLGKLLTLAAKDDRVTRRKRAARKAT